MSEEEVRLAKQWYDQEHVAPSEIAARLGRSKTSMTRLLVQQKPRKKQGAPRKLSEAKVDFLVKRLDELVVKADCKYTVTTKLLKHSARVQASERTIRDALHSRDVWFRTLREKPTLTPDDVCERFKFAKKYCSKSKDWWQKNVHSFIDGKHFQVYLNGESRRRAAQHATFGAYRPPGKGLSGGYVKPKKTLKFNPGTPSTLVMAGVGRGRVMMWHSVPNGRWNGGAAAKMYSGPLRKALSKAWPLKRKWSVLEDNDPTGFKSNKGKEAKAGAGIEPFVIPKRSPDLSLCDYALWPEINRRMRRQELKWGNGKRESREEYLKRLKTTAMRLPKVFVEKAIGDMKRRCELLREVKGLHFEEGGR